MKSPRNIQVIQTSGGNTASLDLGDVRRGSKSMLVLVAVNLQKAL